jgi:hypothetical protein
MRKACLIFALICLLFLPSVVLANPQWSTNQSTTFPINYSSTPSEFNVTWTGNNIQNILIEIKNSSVILVNNSSMSNSTYLGDIYNFSIILPAGNWYWKSYANDSNGWNATDSWSFTINPASTIMNLTLNGAEGNKSYNLYQNANFTAFLNIPSKTIYLNSTYPNFITQNGSSSITNITNLSSSGLFNVTAYWSGDQNYSSYSKTYYFDTTPPQYTIISPLSASDYYGLNKTYWFNVSWSDATLDQVWFEFGINSTSMTNKTPVQNASGIFFFPLLDYPTGNYTYRWCANDSLNNVSCTSITNFTINKNPTTLSLTSSSWSVTTGTTVSLICLANNPLSVSLYIDSNVVNTSTSSVSVTASYSAAGSHIVNCSTPETANYSGYYTSNTITVSSPTPTSGPSTGTPSSSFTFAIQNLPSSVSVKAGESTIVNFNVRNTYQFAMTVSTTLKDISSEWYTLSRDSFSIKSINGTEPVAITFNIPSNADAKSYVVRVNVTGKSSGGVTESNERTFTLIVNSNTLSNQTNQTNQTEPSLTAQASTGNETVAGNTNETIAMPTGFSINPNDFRNIVLFLGIMAAGLVFIFRDNFTGFLSKGYKPKIAEAKKEPIEEKKPETKKPAMFASLKDKFSKYKGHRLVIQIKKKDKEKA